MNRNNIKGNKKNMLKKPEGANSTKENNQTTENPPSEELKNRIKKAVEGLYYSSETDAEITVFVGLSAETVDKEEVRRQTEAAADSPVEEKDFKEFFARLTEIKDWYEDEEKKNVQKFIQLKELLENNIRSLKVFRIGKTELDIYAVGLDAENTLIGIKTKAVET